jgi:N4-gp56 family major capsid protein
MTVNLAAKYSPVVDERFKLKSMTEAAVNQSYEWSGVDTVTVYDIPTSAMNDYVRTGVNRYGTPAELQNNKTSYVLSKDRGFTFTIDKGNAEESVGAMDAGKALARQQDEVIVPELDAYRLAAMVTAAIAAGGSPTAAVLTNATAYASFLAMSEYFANNKVPLVGLVAFVTPNFYTLIKEDNNFIKQSEIAQNMLINGQIGEVDGVKIIRIPSIYLPANVDFVGCHPSATVAPKKLEDYKVHDNPPGVSGSLVEGRIIYDAFVLTSKKHAVYAHKNL